MGTEMGKVCSRAILGLTGRGKERHRHSGCRHHAQTERIQRITSIYLVEVRECSHLRTVWGKEKEGILGSPHALDGVQNPSGVSLEQHKVSLLPISPKSQHRIGTPTSFGQTE